MTESQHLHEDLQFVRQAVARREQSAGGPAAISYIWAAYVLIGYAMIDFMPPAAGMFFMVGGIAGGIASAILGKRAAIAQGERDRDNARRANLHWIGGIGLAIVAAFALAAIIPALRGSRGSQVLVVMIGLVYYLWGVHGERYFLWLGPVLIVGGLVVGAVPHYGWTALGAVIAIGLVVPTLFKRVSTSS